MLVDIIYLRQGSYVVNCLLFAGFFRKFSDFDEPMTFRCRSQIRGCRNFKKYIVTLRNCAFCI